MGWKVITPPTSEQWTLSSARLECRLDADGDSPPSHPLDPLILEKIPAAREFCEEYLERALAPQIVELALDRFYDSCKQTSSAAIELPMTPVTSIVSVKYIDTDGTEQTMAEEDYVVDDHQEPNWLLPAYGTTWPSTYAVANAVKIRCACGYSIQGDSPETHPLPWKYRAAMSVWLQSAVHNGGVPTDDAIRAAENLMQLTRLRLGV